MKLQPSVSCYDMHAFDHNCVERLSVAVNSEVSIHLNRHYILKKHQSRAITKPQQEDDVGRVQQAATTTHLDLEALEEEPNPDISGLDKSVAVTSDSINTSL